MAGKNEVPKPKQAWSAAAAVSCVALQRRRLVLLGAEQVLLALPTCLLASWSSCPILCSAEGRIAGSSTRKLYLYLWSSARVLSSTTLLSHLPLTLLLPNLQSLLSLHPLSRSKRLHSLPRVHCCATSLLTFCQPTVDQLVPGTSIKRKNWPAGLHIRSAPPSHRHQYLHPKHTHRNLPYGLEHPLPPSSFTWRPISTPLQDYLSDLTSYDTVQPST